MKKNLSLAWIVLTPGPVTFGLQIYSWSLYLKEYMKTDNIM